MTPLVCRTQYHPNTISGKKRDRKKICKAVPALPSHLSQSDQPNQVSTVPETAVLLGWLPMSVLVVTHRGAQNSSRKKKKKESYKISVQKIG